MDSAFDRAQPLRRGGVSGVLLVAMAIGIAAITWMISSGLDDSANQPPPLPTLPDLNAMPAVQAEFLKSMHEQALAEPDSSQRLTRLAMVYHANLAYDEAETCYERAERLDVQNWQARYGHALLCEERGELAKTADLLQEVVKLEPEFPLAWFRLGEARFKGDRKEAARQAFEKVIGMPGASQRVHEGRMPVELYARYELARLAYERRELDTCVSTTHSLLAEWDFGPARRLLARAYEVSGRRDEAVRQSKMASTLAAYVPPADPFQDELIELSRSCTFLLKQAAVAERGREMQIAENLTQRAVGYAPNDLEAIRKLGTLLQQTGNVNEARAFFEHFLEHHPDDAIAMNDLGTCLVMQGQPDQAMALYRKAIALQPYEAQPYSNLGGALAVAGDRREAETVLRKAVELGPQSVTAWYNLALVLREAGRTDEALECLRQALSHRQEDYKLRTELGLALLSSGQLDEAIRQLSDALEYKPDYRLALGGLIQALSDASRFEDAMELTRRLIEANPSDAAAHLACARLAIRLGQENVAIEHCETALKLQPQMADAQRLRGELRR